MKIVINSHIKSNLALEHLLESLKDIDISCEIIVAVGGYYNNLDYEIINDGNIKYIRYNEFRFNEITIVLHG